MRAGDASVVIAGFGSADDVPDFGSKSSWLHLGKRADGRLVSRAFSVALAIPRLVKLLRIRPAPEVIIARNIEMLLLASVVQKMSKNINLAIVYECLDIHRLQLANNLKGRVLRRLEAGLVKRSSAIVTSSPAFKSNYFSRFDDLPQDIILLENKVLELSGGKKETDAPSLSAAAPAWKIGWFGTLRCEKSLRALSEFAKHAEKQFKIVLRGRPALSVHKDFFGEIAANPNVDFGGSYQNPEDLEEIYSQVHFAWLIDFYEEGQNSDWLLPNRLYEGCRFGVVPVALAGTETARFLQKLNIGIILPDIRQETLLKCLINMTPPQYAALRKQVLAVDLGRWSHFREDSIAFVRFLARLSNHKAECEQAVDTSARPEAEANT